MDRLRLKITDFSLDIDLKEMKPYIYHELFRDFHQFICGHKDDPHEELSVIPAGIGRKLKPDQAHKEILRHVLMRPKLKFPFSNNPLKNIEKDIGRLGRYLDDRRYLSFFEDLNHPEDLMIFPMKNACFLRRQKPNRSALFLNKDLFKRIRPDAVRESIHLITSMALPLHDSMLMHGVGIRRVDKGYLFLGLPDSGKTTIASFSPPEDVISDDGILVEIKGHEVYLSRSVIDQASDEGRVHNSPPDKTHLKMGLFLNQSDKNSLERILPADACSIILKNHIHYFRYFLPESTEKSFNLIVDLCRTTPFYRLNFRKEPFFWTKIEEEIYNIDK